MRFIIDWMLIFQPGKREMVIAVPVRVKPVTDDALSLSN
jgi:hypothetical protein